jgi:polyhydroxybutyrate depolymerase
MPTNRIILKTSLSVVLFLCLTFFANAQYDSITVDGINRTYLLHLPTAYSLNKAFPLVIALHGGTGSAYNIQNQSQLSVKANQESFIVVYPEGIKGGALNVRTWNAGWCCGYASESKVDDIGFISNLLDTLINNYNIDTTRIYATGMSNGGFMTYRIGCELSNRIAAIAPVAASMSLNDCQPSRAMPIIHFHSYLDTNVPYLGGIGDGISGHYNPPVDSVLNAWALLNQCMVNNDTLVDNDQFTFTRWTSCNDGIEIQFYITHDGGHSWPGGNQTSTGDPVSAYIDATDLMWDFFQKYTIAGPVNNITEADFNEFKLYPNPAIGVVTIKMPNSISEFRVAVFNQMGQLVLMVSNQKSIHLEKFPRGLYYIAVQTNKNNFIDKIVLNNE